MRLRAPLLLLTCLALGACGYLAAGTWEDDPKNWGRAFRSRKPDDVVVAHSLYWRSPHWSYEFKYYFEVEPHEGLRRQLLSQNDLVRLEGEQAQGVHRDRAGGAPTWFAPEPCEGYETWVYSDRSRGDFALFIDRATGSLFLADRQL